MRLPQERLQSDRVLEMSFKGCSQRRALSDWLTSAIEVLTEVEHESTPKSAPARALSAATGGCPRRWSSIVSWQPDLWSGSGQGQGQGEDEAGDGHCGNESTVSLASPRELFYQRSQHCWGERAGTGGAAPPSTALLPTGKQWDLSHRGAAVIWRMTLLALSGERSPDD